MELSIVLLLVAGATGALCKDIVQDNSLTLPRKVNGNFSLGFLGGMATGAMAGYFVDGNPTTAFLAGYAGTSVIEHLLIERKSQKNQEQKSVEDVIRVVARQEGVDPDLAVRVAKCESNLDPLAVHVNKDGSRDRGAFQWNDKWHPEVSDADAFDVVKATQLFCKAFKAGHLDWWNATKKCWSLDK